MVTVTWLPLETDMRILSMPLGPRVLLTRSEIAMAPTKDARRACSPFSSVAPSWSTDGPALPIIDILTLDVFLRLRRNTDDAGTLGDGQSTIWDEAGKGTGARSGGAIGLDRARCGVHRRRAMRRSVRMDTMDM